MNYPPKRLSLRFSVIVFLSITLLGCNQTPENRHRISPPPANNDLAGRKAALKALSEAIRSSPSIETNYYKRAVIYYDNRDYENALADLNRANELHPNVAKFLLLKAQIFLEQNKINEATRLVKQVESQNYNDLNFSLLNARLAVLNRDTTLAKAGLANLHQNAPYTGAVYYVDGLYKKRLQRDTTAAVLDFYQAIKYNPKDRKSYQEVIDYLGNAQLPDSALVVLNQAIRQFPNESGWLNEKAEIFRKSGKYEMAWQAYNQLAEQDPKNAEARQEMGNMRLAQKDYGAAIQHYNDAIKLTPNDSNLYFLAGFCSEKQNNLSAALRYYTKAVQLNPENSQAVQARDRTNRLLNQAIGLPF